VGRRRELDRILSGVLGAGPAVAVVVGPSGSGKSRLLAEVAARSPLPVVAARAFLPEREEAWGLARTLLRELLSLDVQAADAVPELAAAALCEILPELAELRPITAVAIDPQSRRALTLQGAVQLVAAAAEEPLVVVDDLQWADASSLDLLQLAAQRVAGLRLVVAHRPEEVAEPGPVSLFLASLAELATRSSSALARSAPTPSPSCSRTRSWSAPWSRRATARRWRWWSACRRWRSRACWSGAPPAGGRPPRR
jgi:hypothetical protein